MKEFYTYYTLADASVSTYVGKGKGKRVDDHLKAITRFGNHLRKQLSVGVFPITVIRRGLSEQEAFAREIELVAKFGRKDLGTGSLYNRTNGGEGPSGCVKSPETLAKMSECQKGKVLSQETRRKIGLSSKGRRMPDEARARISASHIGIKHTDETKAKMSFLAKARHQLKKQEQNDE